MSLTRICTFQDIEAPPPNKCCVLKLKNCAFAITLIVAIGALIMAAFGIALHVGVLSNPDQVSAIAMMATGGSIGSFFMITCVARVIKNCMGAKGVGLHSQSKTLLDTFNQRSQTSSFLRIVDSSPLESFSTFEREHPAIAREITEEALTITDTDQKKIDKIFGRLRKQYPRLWKDDRKSLTHAVNFYESNTERFRAMFEFLSRKAGSIVSEVDESDLLEVLIGVLPACKWEVVRTRNGSEDVGSVSLNFLKDMISLAVVGRLRKIEYWHYIHVIGNCGKLYSTENF